MLIIEMLAGSAQGVGLSLTVTTTTTPYAKVFYDLGATFTEAEDFLSAAASANPTAARFSPVGDVLAVGSVVTPYIHFYDNGMKLSSPGTLPTSAVSDVAWSPDGARCAVAMGTSPYIAIYKRFGSTYEKQTNPFDSLPTSQARGCAWSDDGVYLAVATNSSPYNVWYKRSGEAYTKLTNPDSLPAGNANGCAWAPSGAYLAVTHAVSPYLKVYKRTADTLSVSGVTIPTIGASSAAFAGSWSADGVYLAMGINASPYFIVLKRSGDTFTKIANPASLPSGTVSDISFSGSDRIAIRAGLGDVQIYSLAADVLTLVSGTGLPSADASTVSFYPPAVAGSP
jgi:WD40 repeat protein